MGEERLYTRASDGEKFVPPPHADGLIYNGKHVVEGQTSAKRGTTSIFKKRRRGEGNHLLDNFPQFLSSHPALG